jgi:hypothetical protein
LGVAGKEGVATVGAAMEVAELVGVLVGAPAKEALVEKAHSVVVQGVQGVAMAEEAVVCNPIAGRRRLVRRSP